MNDGDGEPEAGAEAVHHPARGEQADRVRDLKGEDDVGVVHFAPAELQLQRGFEEADHLAIDVVERGGQEEQAADDPAEGTGRVRPACPMRLVSWLGLPQVTRLV